MGPCCDCCVSGGLEIEILQDIKEPPSNTDRPLNSLNKPDLAVNETSATKQKTSNGKYFPSNQKQLYKTHMPPNKSREVSSSSIHQRVINHTQSDRQSQLLQSRQNEFQLSPECQNYQRQTDINVLLSTAYKAFELKMLDLSQKIFKKSLEEIERQKQSIHVNNRNEIILRVKLQLIDMRLHQRGLSQNQKDEVSRLFAECILLYNGMEHDKVVEEKIALMNNMAVFYSRNRQLKKAIKVGEETLQLVRKYYYVNDERRFFTMANLASFYFESGNITQGNKYSDTVRKYCPDELTDIRDTVCRNQVHYNKSVRNTR